MSARKTPGQLAYETELTACPLYHDGTPRRSWDELDEISRLSWERTPTPRKWAMQQKEG